jgi:hypothetical protein
LGLLAICVLAALAWSNAFRKKRRIALMNSRKTLTTIICLVLLLTAVIPARFSSEAASRPPIRGKNGMVASVSQIASQVGVDVMKRGGNAIDAAIAVAFAEPALTETGGLASGVEDNFADAGFGRAEPIGDGAKTGVASAAGIEVVAALLGAAWVVGPVGGFPVVPLAPIVPGSAPARPRRMAGFDSVAGGDTACSRVASIGGVFDNYAIVQGVDQVVPVDVFVPGCPPRPESLIYAIVQLQKKISESKL